MFFYYYYYYYLLLINNITAIIDNIIIVIIVHVLNDEAERIRDRANLLGNERFFCRARGRNKIQDGIAMNM